MRVRVYFLFHFLFPFRLVGDEWVAAAGGYVALETIQLSNLTVPSQAFGMV